MIETLIRGLVVIGVVGCIFWYFKYLEKGSRKLENSQVVLKTKIDAYKCARLGEIAEKRNINLESEYEKHLCLMEGNSNFEEKIEEELRDAIEEKDLDKKEE